MLLVDLHVSYPDVRLALWILAFAFFFVALICFGMQVREVGRKRLEWNRIELRDGPRLVWSAPVSNVAHAEQGVQPSTSRHL